jgi:hypothetical protein
MTFHSIKADPPSLPHIVPLEENVPVNEVLEEFRSRAYLANDEMEKGRTYEGVPFTVVPNHR